MKPITRARSEQAKDKRRRALLAAALEEFFARGFTAARMEDVARRAGLSKGTLYLYVDSKQELFVELIRTIAMPKVERIEQIADSIENSHEAIRTILAVAAVMVRESPLPRVVKVLIAESGAFPEVVRSYREQVLDRVFAALARILERGRAAGELKIRNADLAVRLVVAPIIFSAIWRVVFETGDEDRLDLESLYQLHADTLLHGLSATDPRGSNP